MRCACVAAGWTRPCSGSDVLHDGTDSPTLAVEVDLGRMGYFTLGVSALGGPDVLASSLPVPSNWSAFTAANVREIHTRRGRTREDQAVQPGTATIVLDNRSGLYDPDNPTGPYLWNGYSVLAKGLPLRVRATYSATTYTLWSGYIEDVVPDQSLDPVTTITATDALAWLGQQPLAQISAAYSGDTTAARAGRILDAVGWSASARSLTGSRIMRDTTYNTSALALLEEVARCENGRFYATRDGIVTLLPYESTFTTTQRLTLSDQRTAGTIEYDNLVTSPGASYQANTVNITTTTGTVITYANAGSVARYGTLTKAISAPLLNGTEASALAQSVAERFAFPTTRVDRVEFDGYGAGSLWASILQADLAERVRVERTTVDGRNRIYGCVIESISIDITPAAWRVGYDLSPGASSVYFTLGTSVLGGTDQLYY